MDDFIDIAAIFEKALQEAFRERGHVNVLIAGRTGVGKSTLINAVFQGQFATTGHGKPVTQETEEITKDGIPLSIFDTRGLELADYKTILDDLRGFVSKRAKESDATKHIHIAWVCISEDLRRVEAAEIKLTETLAEFMPVVGVITKARADRNLEFQSEVERLLPKAHKIVRVRSICEEFDDGHINEQMGLPELVGVTMGLIPDGARRAFTAAEKVDIGLKKTQSRIIVVAAATSAAGVAVSPIPFSDWTLIVPIQVGMIAGITATFGLSLRTAAIFSLVASAITGTAASLAGRAIVSGLLKLVPGVGTALGGTISATTAAALTKAFGETYIATLELLFTKNNGEPPSEADILDTFWKLYIQRSND